MNIYRAVAAGALGLVLGVAGSFAYANAKLTKDNVSLSTTSPTLEDNRNIRDRKTFHFDGNGLTRYCRSAYPTPNAPLNCRVFIRNGRGAALTGFQDVVRPENEADIYKDFSNTLTALDR